MSSIPWLKRKSRLRVLLQSQASEDDDGVALDRLLHGQRVIGKTAKTTEIDTLRFQDSDLQVVGTLEYGQFGVIDVVTCTIDGRVYVRKSTQKVFASRTRDQCSPQIERNILLQAAKTDSPWAPHLFCAYQNTTHLNLVMDYAEGGSLWDVLESSPTRGRLPEEHVTRWWAPQIISAIDWCHSQGFVHRDIKPHNFVLTPSAHILLIDFGSAAPLLSPEADGSRRLAREHCTVPCGTCDYISPEILKAHERALVAIELEDDTQASILVDDDCDAYGLETDWWSLGAMLYEMVYGVAPFFAEDIRRTYTKITDHKRHLNLNSSSKVSSEFHDLLRGLLTDAEFRLGRCDASEITSAAVFVGVDWSSLTSVTAPPGLHVPQFTYAEPVAAGLDQKSQAFGFDALFESSPGGYTAAGSLAQSTRSRSQTESMIGSALLDRSVSSQTSSASDDRPSPLSFIGFSWGPVIDEASSLIIPTSSPALLAVPTLTPARPLLPIPFATPLPKGLQPGYAFSTPIRPNARGLLTPFQTVKSSKPGVLSTTRRRELSDREAMKQMVDCIGMSARKRVMESGRKPRTKALRDRSLSKSYTRPRSSGARRGPQPIDTALGAVRTGKFVIVDRTQDSGMTSQLVDTDLESGLEGTSDGEDERDLIMMSPSPSPRPGSAMSMTMSRRSNEPTVSLMLNPSTASLTAPLSSRWNGNGHVPAEISRSSGGRRQSRKSIEEVGLNEDILDEMEDKYGMLMYDIEGLESRLGKLSTSNSRSF